MKDYRLSRTLGTALARVILITASILVVFPLLWTFYTSFKTNQEFFNSIWSLPKTLQWDNYVRAFETAKIDQFFFNSLIATSSGLISMLVLTVPPAYAFSRFEFRGKKILFNFILSGMFVSGTFTIIPIFLMMSKMNLLNKPVVLGILYAAGAIPYNLFLLTGFFKGVSVDYEHAASIDGCGYLRTLLHVIVPLSSGGLSIVMIFSFLGYWNEYILAFTLLREEVFYTIPIGMVRLMEIQQFATDWGALFAGLVTVMFPVLLVYIFAQKKLTQGLSIGGLKG
ncbi:MAG: carbohydrate ABC transporter permease [Spirochaetales bacterium]|nr:carbohydrate ABC transporter permease [Spirochaetales bacterium]